MEPHNGLAYSLALAKSGPGRGASKQTFALGITRPLHGTAAWQAKWKNLGPPVSLYSISVFGILF